MYLLINLKYIHLPVYPARLLVAVVLLEPNGDGLPGALHLCRLRLQLPHLKPQEQMFHLDDGHLLLAGLPGPAVLRVHGNGAQVYHQQ